MSGQHSHTLTSLQPCLRSMVRPLSLGLLLASYTFVICFLRSFLVPATPILLWGDQVGFFDNGSRIVMGELPYRDYFQIVPPGTDLTYAVLIKCFGLSMWIPNLVMACLAALIALLMTLTAGRLMRGPIVALPGLLFTGFILLGSLDGTHHWFSTVAVMGAMLVLLDGITFPRVAAAGVLCGLAACFTQSKGGMAVVGFIGYLAWDAWRHHTAPGECCRKCLILCATATAIFMSANTYFVWNAGLCQWLFCVLEYPLRYYSAAPINSWLAVVYDFRWHRSIASHIAFLFVYSTVPTVYVLFLLRVGKRREKEHEVLSSRLALVLLTGIAILLAIAASPSPKRLSTVSPPAMILLGWLLSRPGKINTRLTAVLTIASIALAIAVPIRVQTRWHAYLDLPGGRAALLDPGLSEEYRWALEHTRPGQYFFGLSPLYAALRLRNPAPIEGLHPSEYSRPEQVAAVVEGLEKYRVPLLILRQSKDLLTSTGSSSDHLEPFRTYVFQNYRLAKTFPTEDDVWQRIDSP